MENQRVLLENGFHNFMALNSYIKEGIHKAEAEVDIFIERLPDSLGYAVFAGLRDVCEYLENLAFTSADIELFEGARELDSELFDYLKSFRFSGILKSVPEGSAVFAGEPIITLRAPLGEIALLESAILRIVRTQTLSATRLARLACAAHGLPVIDMGEGMLGADAALYAARGARIGGACATTHTLAGKKLGIPLVSVMPHSFVQSVGDEYTAFVKWLESSHSPAVLTLDTYDTLASGVENAVRAILAVRESRSLDVSVRIESGELIYLSKRVRERLCRAGLADSKIMATGELDEYKIRTLLKEGAPIDCFGVSKQAHLGFDVTCRLAALEENGVMTPKIKLGESFSKISLPGSKKLLRFFDKRTGKAIADEICLANEPVPNSRHTVFDPEAPWKAKELVNFEVREMLETVMEGGERKKILPPLDEIRERLALERATLSSSVERLDVGERYFVDLSEKLWTLRRRMTGAKRSAFFMR